MNSLCSGIGQFHTNEFDPAKPNKKLTPYITVSWSEIKAMVDSPQAVDKRAAQWLIPSSLLSRTFKTQEEQGEYWLQWVDIDKNTPKTLSKFRDDLQSFVDGDFEIYTSRSARADFLKCRALIPLSEPLSGSEWMLAQEALNDKLEQLGYTTDRKSQCAAQLCYLPNRGAYYEGISRRNGAYFDPMTAFHDAIKSKREAVTQAQVEAEARREAAKAKRERLTVSDVGASPDTLIGAFNAAFAVEDILLQSGYDQRGNTFRHPMSESGSFSASIKDGRVHSLSTSDPLYTNGGGVGGHDAFGAFCTLFHGGDLSVALRDAGDNWLKIGDLSWNEVRRGEVEWPDDPWLDGDELGVSAKPAKDLVLNDLLIFLPCPTEKCWGEDYNSMFKFLMLDFRKH